MRIGSENVQYIDVICQHCKNGKIIPMRIRLVDEDGERQTYTIKSYRDLTYYGDSSKNDLLVTPYHIRSFSCKILVWGTEKDIQLSYNTNEQRWRVTS